MSSFFEWDQTRYTVRVEAMDREHKGIVDCMNRLHRLSEAGAAAAQLAPVVNELVQLTVRHFADEEAYMERIKFPGLDRHRIIHKNLLEKVTQHKAAFQASGKLTDDFFNFLKMWLKSHICGIDVQYGEHRVAA